MKIKAYGLKRGDLFEHEEENFKFDGAVGNHIRAVNGTTTVLIPKDCTVNLKGSVLPSRDKDIKNALEL
jgi:hypothetical protein